MDTKTPSTSHLRLVKNTSSILTGDDGSGGDGLGPAVINLTGKDASDIVRQVVHHLCQDKYLFVYGHDLYKMTDRPEGYEGPPEFHRIDKISGICVQLLSRGLVYEKTKFANNGGKTSERTEPPFKLALWVHAEVVRRHPQRLRQLSPLTEHKMLRDGTLTKCANQYVQTLQVWTMLADVPQPVFEFDRLDEFRIGIKNVLRHLYRFRDDKDLHSAMALVSSLALIDILRGPIMPIWIFNAAQEGCGKTTCAKFVHAITRVPCQTQQYLRNQEELEKRLASSVEKSTSSIFFDNTKVDVTSALIESYATSWGEVPEYRRLGKNEFVQNPLRFLTVFTMNNGKCSRDLMRRSLEVFLEHPNKGKTVDNETADKHAYERGHYTEVLGAYVLDIVAYVYKEVPEGFITWEKAYEFFWGEKAPNLGTHNIDVSEEAGTGTSIQLAAIIKAAKVDDEWMLSQFAVDQTEANDPRIAKEGELAEAIFDFAEHIREKNSYARHFNTMSMRKSIGKKLAEAAKSGVIIDGKVLVTCGKRKNAVIYKVVEKE